MGQNIEHSNFVETDYLSYQQKLYEQLEQLKHNISKPIFGHEEQKIGAELEVYLIDKQGNPQSNNIQLIEHINDPQLQPELNKYNLEINFNAYTQQGTPLSSLHREITEKMSLIEESAYQFDTFALPIGILPTLRKQHLNAENMTNIPRYQCLADHLYQQRGDSFNININGKDSLNINLSDICAEGANTSFQVHLMVKPEKIVDIFNAALLTLPLVTAISANSPYLLGKELWDETRIALFKQSLDTRHRKQVNWQEPTRVSYGHGWLRKDIWEFFAQAVSLYPPLIPYIKHKGSNDEMHLNELSFHLGTIWPWIRPVYSPENNGHIRIEFRAIPAGPTAIDMVANAAFAIGLSVGVSNIDELISYIPFKFSEYNFYRAAKNGLNAKVLWPLKNKYQAQEVDIKQVIERFLPIALKGLISLNIHEKEAHYYISIIEKRLASQCTGAVWQKNTLQRLLQQNINHNKACQQLVQQYLANSKHDQPVATWDTL